MTSTASSSGSRLPESTSPRNPPTRATGATSASAIRSATRSVSGASRRTSESVAAGRVASWIIAEPVDEGEAALGPLDLDAGARHEPLVGEALVGDRALAILLGGHGDAAGEHRVGDGVDPHELALPLLELGLPLRAVRPQERAGGIRCRRLE